MPRRKQSNPQPVKLDSEDGLGVDNPGSLVLESDFLLGQDLEFGDSDDKIIGFERDSEDSVAAEIVIPVYALSDDDCSSYNRLSMESDAEDPRDTESEREESHDHTLQHYLSCRQCGQLLDSSLGGLDLATPYCLKCGDSGEGGGGEEDETTSVSAPDSKENGGSNGSVRKVYSCKLCSFSSRYSNHLKRHMKTHNGEKPFKCPHCTYASAQLVNLQRHVRTHTGEKPFKCEYCAFACNSLGNLKRHERMHTQDKPNKCNLCDYRANNSRNLKRHMMGHETEEPPGAAEDAVVSDLTLHVSNSTDFLQSYTSLKPEMDPRSLLDTDGVAEESDTLPELLFPFTCRLCGLVLDDGFMHEDGSSSQICSKCGLEMLSKEAPSSPEKSDKVYSCALCPFITHYPNHLARHMKTHSGEKPYKCPQCDYASAHFDNLKRHQRVHTGEKPYKCHLCDYACGNLANLKRHERIHSGAKPFKCSVCNYSCNQSMNLKRHMLRHTGEKPFKCQECPYTTGHWDNYKRHQKKHGHSTEGWTKVQQPGSAVS
ncbi:zinc finger protein 513 isoform X1 [Lepisosteus oculatus]|uniref:Zinc finger protein 513 n=1 Tax=Lepisosteus oculatus TaxID=7918 RepID=W5NJ78_LEPOC|nr:PREDICTED: zinc finger protein 513 isoform X1 [Lepisosteus oculatus]XP_015208028.1 PREDICTED: zinc finger protein 513 isoform X1 [Lepisosteus oculatus]XP_015208034.1 PREDICTED: zinc finger protein 513 isoform X1 [Lepisosteus oculatus]